MDSNMAWMSQYILWVTLVSTSAFKCKYPTDFGVEDSTRPRYPGTQHRIDENPQNHDRVYARATKSNSEYITVTHKANPEVVTEERNEEGSYQQSNPSPYQSNTNLVRLNLNLNTSPRTEDRETFDGIRHFGEIGFKTNVQGNERSLPVSSDIQRVNEQEKRRFDGKKREESLPRFENGSYKIVNNFPKTFLNIGSRRGAPEDKRPATTRAPIGDNVVFPGPTSMSYLPDVSEECKRTGICVDVPNYPEDLVTQIVEKLGDATNKFRVDEFVPEIAQRLGPVDNFIELCNYREDLVVPRAAQDKDGKWHFILNPKDKPLQGYRVEICHGKNLPCSTDIAYFNQGYEGICHQKYVERYMTGLDDKGHMIEKPFKVPSCCSCVVRSVKDKFDD